MTKADVVGGVGIALLGILLIFVIIPFGTEEGTYYGLSPTFFPTLLACIMTFCAAALVVQGWLRLRSATEHKATAMSRWNLLMFLVAAVIAILGIVVIDFFGILAGGPLFIAAFMLFLGERNVIRIALTATLPVALVYILATYVLHAPLP